MRRNILDLSEPTGTPRAYLTGALGLGGGWLSAATMGDVGSWLPSVVASQSESSHHPSSWLVATLAAGLAFVGLNFVTPREPVETRWQPRVDLDPRYIYVDAIDRPTASRSDSP